MVARPGRERLPAARIARAVQIQRYPDDLEVAEYLAVCFLLDLGDGPVHRLGDLGKVARSHSPSNRDGIASYSWALMLMTPVTWLTLPS